MKPQALASWITWNLALRSRCPLILFGIGNTLWSSKVATEDPMLIVSQDHLLVSCCHMNGTNPQQLVPYWCDIGAASRRFGDSMVFLFPMAHGSPLSYLDALDAPFFPFGPVFGGHRFAASRAQRHPKDVRPASKNWFGTCFGLWKLRSDRYGQELILQVSRYWTSWSIFCPSLSFS
jgi:hypothetical protein